MEQPAVTILNSQSSMAISTVRPDGWPQTTIVGYANRGFDLVFLIYRASQKYANIQHDDRISIAVLADAKELSDLKAVYAGAHAREITDPAEREKSWKLLMERHANLAGFKIPDAGDAVFMSATCKYVSVLDFTKGIGHREQLTIGGDGAPENIDHDKVEWGAEGNA